MLPPKASANAAKGERDEKQHRGNLSGRPNRSFSLRDVLMGAPPNLLIVRVVRSALAILSRRPNAALGAKRLNGTTPALHIARVSALSAAIVIAQRFASHPLHRRVSNRRAERGHRTRKHNYDTKAWLRGYRRKILTSASIWSCPLASRLKSPFLKVVRDAGVL
jgi:hypothetical protein